MIYCVWYPSGGFGHFINGVLTLHGKNFKRPTNDITFSENGNSHSLNLVAPKYTPGYKYKFDSDCNYSLLIDQGINSTSRDFMLEFPNARVIKVCYTDSSWPIVAKTMIDKAMQSSIEQEVAVDPEGWASTEPWARREKYFLFLRDHPLRTAWQPESGIDCILVNDLLDYPGLKHAIKRTGIELSEFKDLWNNWYINNERYVAPIAIAEQVLSKIKHKETFDLSHITDVWTQAVIYYYIWTEFGKEVPHNDFENFFSNVNQITQWLNQ
jgi:hypothetical protein